MSGWNIKTIFASSTVTFAIILFILYLSGSLDILLNKDSDEFHPKVIYKTVDTEEKANINVYKRISPGVVNITKQVLRYTDLLKPDFMVAGIGSGIVYDKQGHIITNYHVINGASKLTVNLNGFKYDVTKVFSDPENDLAIIQIKAPEKELFPIKLGNSDLIETGEKVLAIGNPFGLEKTLTSGIISSIGRTILNPESGHYIAGVIQTDAAINPGNSGGPLLNAKGELIGINTSIYTISNQNNKQWNVGIGFAIPSNTIKLVANDLIHLGIVRRPKLGIGGFPVSRAPGLSEFLKLPGNYGVLVLQVQKDSPAEQAGIKGANKVESSKSLEQIDIPLGGDVILSIDNIKIKDYRDISLALRNKREGDRVKVTIMRPGSNSTIKDIYITLTPSNNVY